MKFKAFKQNSMVKIGIISLIAATLSIAAANTTIANPAQTLQSVGAGSLMAQSQPRIAFSGTFVAAEAPTTGTVRILEQGGQRYLVLDSAFSTNNQAPDLHVLLETAGVPPRTYSNFGSFVNLGKLHRVNGEQRYPIPNAINLSQFRSVAIWCRMANATMGYATLAEGSNARTQ